MWIKFTPDYLAGIMTGAGLACFFTALAVRSGMISPSVVSTSGCVFTGLALILGGGGYKWRTQQAAR